jgi:hypothetical protein
MALDIVFISYGEPNADKNWALLADRFPWAQRVDMVEGIPQAFIEAARISHTSHVWTVDADNIIKSNFHFQYEPEPWDGNYVHLWYAQNPVNGLTYGYGGIKLWPRRYLKDAHVEEHSVDFTVPASQADQAGLKIWEEVASITEFNTNEFQSYRAGFREGAKLAVELSSSDDRASQEAQARLETWCTVGKTEPFGEECIQGACDGRHYGLMNAGNPAGLARINSFEFIEGKFNDR